MRSCMLPLLLVLVAYVAATCVSAQEPNPPPIWPVSFQARFGLDWTPPLAAPVVNSTSFFFYNLAPNVTAQLIDYPSFCPASPKVIGGESSGCKLLFNEVGIYVSQPSAGITCCQLFAGVGPTPRNFTRGFTWNGTQPANDYYGTEHQCDYWMGGDEPFEFLYYTEVGTHHDVLFHDGAGPDWAWDHLNVTEVPADAFALFDDPATCNTACGIKHFGMETAAVQKHAEANDMHIRLALHHHRLQERELEEMEREILDAAGMLADNADDDNTPLSLLDEPVQTHAASASSVSASSPAGSGPLPAFSNIRNRYVIGISSGGFMAGQLHVAYSSLFQGAGIWAAGPYNCAMGSLVTALAQCMSDDVPVDLDAIESALAVSVQTGQVDSLDNLRNSPTWVWHGTLDALVKNEVAEALVEFYHHLGANVSYQNTTAANHAWVTPLGVQPCDVLGSPFLNVCPTDVDPQHDMFAHILQRPLNPRAQNTTGQLIQFSQDYYSLKKWGLLAWLGSMDSTGWLYVPAACNPGMSGNESPACDVVVMLHGCESGQSYLGTEVIERANVNNYADTNNFIVLYPQAVPLIGGVVINGEGCWDWWGYLGDDAAYAQKGSWQMEAITSMVLGLQGEEESIRLEKFGGAKNNMART